MSIPLYPVAKVLGTAISDGEAGFDVAFEMIEGDRFIVRLPPASLGALASALLAGTEKMPGGERQMPIVQGMFLQPSEHPEKEVLTMRVEGGGNIQFLVAEGRYHRGILAHMGAGEPVPDRHKQ